MTRAHNDNIEIDGEDYGYSIRVGKKLPQNSVNMAYVHAPAIGPKSNLIITDMSQEIPENVIQENTMQDTLLFPDDTFLLRELGRSFYASSRNILITDEFSVPKTNQEGPAPLYYKIEVKGYFNARRSTVALYPGGFVERPIEDVVQYSQVPEDQRSTLIYLGDKIRITNLDGTELSSDLKYKIELIKQEGSGIPEDAYRIVIYTNFRSEKDQTYMIHYEKYNLNGTISSDTTEVLNVYPFYKEVEKSALDALAENPKENGQWASELQGKHYAVAETEDQTWQIFAPSQVIIADNTTRPAHQFKYRIKGRLRSKLTTGSNPGEIKIGLIYLNNTVFNAESLQTVMKKVYEHGLRPPYLEFSNPHHPFVGVALSEQDRANLKSNTKYFNIDITMPSDYLNEYDLIILTGYGSYDMSLYNESLRTYLQNGGRLWIDNAGSGSEVLNLQNFLLNVSFSKTESSIGSKGYGIPDAQLGEHDIYSVERQAINRLYLLEKTNMTLGYSGVNPKIVFGPGETQDMWTNIVRYTNNDPSIMIRQAYSSGQIILSNCGVYRSLANRESDDIKLAMNIILTIAEEKVVMTPWMHDYVYHRDNLFKEEYKNGETDAYIDDRSDIDNTQIVAKKMIEKSVRDALLPYMPSAYYKAKGTFSTEVSADTSIVVENNDMEVGRLNPTTGQAVTEWTGSETNAIPGWSTVLLEGQMTFNHSSLISEKGQKSIQLKSTALARGYWTSKVNQITADTYRLTAWVKTVGVSGTGADVRVMDSKGVLLGSGQAVAGDQDWVKVEVQFGVTKTTDIELRLGFLSEAAAGTVWIDFIELVSLGSVYMTPENTGDRPLYAYAIRPRSDSFNLQKEGFSSADVTVYDPDIEVYYSIRSFVYVWNNDLSKYVKQYGNSKTYKSNLRRSDGIKSLGLLTTLLPGLNAGTQWAEKSRVFYEITAGQIGETNDLDEFINVRFFNKKTGQYYYAKNGENVIGYSQLFDTSDTQLNIIAQVWTDYYTIRATKRRYAVRPLNTGRIYLEHPSTIDERNSWFLRVKNGEFSKNELNYKEYEKFKDQFSSPQEYGKLKYSLPEYDRQNYKPMRPFRRVLKETCEYVNEYTLKVQNAPLHIVEGSIRGELMTPSLAGQLYTASYGEWVKGFTPVVYLDQNNTGDYIQIADGYDIDPINGAVIFDEPQKVGGTGAPSNVKVDYNHKNIHVFKRTYGNVRIKKERLESVDGKIFKSAHSNWIMNPSPVVYRLPHGKQDEKSFIAPVSTYEVNYEEGSLRFYEEVSDRVYIDFSYGTDRELRIRDYDIQSGLIYLETAVQFKDEIYANYTYEEQFVEYRGYYDYEVGQFIHLDLNPSDGHYCTMPKSYDSRYSKFESVPTSKLMNKEVYIYLLPYKTSFEEDATKYTIRHCYSKSEWEKIENITLGRALLLGKVQLRENSQVKDVTVLDTRQRGGGLKESISNTVANKKDDLTRSYWDMSAWDGMAYYKNGVLVLELPQNILQTNGGQFSEKDIDEILKRYVAYGTYTIIEYVDK